jgi:beta-lactam-binding protein with PASTA domain
MTNGVDTRTCETCRAPVQADHDFCPNGHFIAWETFDQASAAERQPAPGPVVPAAAPPARPDVAAVLDVSLVGAPRRALPAGVAAVAHPGMAVKLVATVRNEGTVVDDYTVQVQGLPEAWVPAQPGEAHLLSIVQQHDYEKRLEFAVLAPLTPQATAKAWQFSVVVTSVAAGGAVVARQDCTIEVLPFWSIVVAARPAIARGRRRATFFCEVRNNGNRPIVPLLAAADADGTCRIVLPPSIDTIAPGGTRAYPIRVVAPGPLLIGRPLDRLVTVGAVVDGLATPPPPQIVTFRQRPILPWWLIPLFVLLLAAAAFVYTQWPHKVRTPSLKGVKSAFVAQGELQKAGFTAAPVVRTRVLARPAAGTVYDQRPSAGTKVSRDTVVTIRVAVPPTTTIIPDLSGETAQKADGTLFRAHLALGNVVPSPKSKNTIVSQIPRAGSVKPRNTVVNVVLADSKAVPIPNLACMTPAEAETALNKSGFKLMVVPTTVSPAAHVRGQIPSFPQKRKPGAVVTLQFFGPPPICPKTHKKLGFKPTPAGAGKNGASAAPVGSIAYSIDGVVRVSGAAGSQATGTQPAWSPGGSLLAARAGDQITVTRPRRSTAPVATFAIPGSALATPAFAPDGDPPVLAFVASRTAADAPAQLCFVTLAPTPPAPSCREIGYITPRSLAWSPDGRTVLLAAAGDADPFGPSLMRFRAARPAATDAASWQPLQADGDGLHPVRRAVLGAVLDAAYLPGGKRVALITDLRPTGVLAGPQVVLVDAPTTRSRDLTGLRWLRVPGCSLDVSPDGAQLAVGAPDDRKACEAPGALMTVPIAHPRARVTLVARGSGPAWGGP